jgi:hypothetical protein
VDLWRELCTGRVHSARECEGNGPGTVGPRRESL